MPAGLPSVAADQATQRELIEEAVRSGSGTVTDQMSITGTKEGTAYIVWTTINGEVTEIHYSVWSTGEVEVASAWVIPFP